MNILLVSGDLMLVAAAEGIARQVGGTLTTAGAASAIESCQAAPPAIVAIDLRAAGTSPGELVPALRAAAPGAMVMAFGPHVHEAALAAAREAGCDEVVTRGQFEMRLRAAVERAAGAKPS